MATALALPGSADKRETPVVFEQRKKKLLKGRALEAWANIRTTLKGDEDKHVDVNQAGNKRSITHGMQHMYSIPIGVSITDVLYNETCEEYVILDESGTISVYRASTGKHIANFLMDDRLESFVFLSNLTRYIGLSRGTGAHSSDATFVVYSQNLKVLSRYLTGVSVSCMVYNPFRRQLVSSGLGNLHTWTLHYEDTHILPEVSQQNEELEEFDFNLMVFEHNAGYSQRIYTISGTTCCVFKATTLDLLEVKRSLHVRNISALAYFNPGKALVTGSVDGTIKMWDESWCIKVVFVGHNDPVVSLGVYPNGPFVISSSSDNTVRVWSLETSDESLVLEVHSTASQIVSRYGYEQVAAVHNDELYVYKVEELFHLFTSVGEPVRRIRKSYRYESKRTLVCCCEDSTVRLICPLTGKVINTILFNHDQHVKDAVAIKRLNAVFCLMESNEIVEANLSTNPAVVTNKWNCATLFPGLKVHSFCVYQHIGGQDLLKQGHLTADEAWNALARATVTDEIKPADGPKSPKQNPTMLFVGRNDGAIALIDMETSEIRFEVQAHEMSNITLLVDNPSYDQLISAGTDKVVKVWKVFPANNIEPLVVVFPFYFPGTPTHVSVSRNKIFVAFQDAISGLYSSVVHTQERTRFDHPRVDDHTDKIVAIASNPKLKLFVSASEDATLRIWSDHSRLIRVLRLNSHIWSVEFCTETGDLVVGIADHIYRIEHTRYFTKSLMYRMMTIPFETLTPETPVTYDESKLEALELSDLKRLKAVHCSDMKFSTFEDTLPPSEQKEINEARKTEEAKFLHLAKRDAELEILKNCDFDMLKLSKKQRNEKIQQVAFKKYISMFLENVKVDLPKTDEEPVLFAPALKPKKDKFIPEKEPVGFFPALDQNHLRESNIKVNISGYLPNSIALKCLYPEDTLKAHEELFKPREFTAEELEQLEYGRKVREEGQVEEEDEAWMMEDDLPATPPDQAKSDLLSKLQQAAKTPSPPPEPEMTEAEKEALEREQRVQELQEQAQAKENLVEAASTKKKSQPIRKLVSRVKPKSPPPMEPVAQKPKAWEDEVPTEESTRPETPLPEWLTRSKTQLWYEKFFPDLNERTFPKPWYPANFASMVLRYIKTCDMQYKASMVDYLKDLHLEWDLGPISNDILDALLFVLNKSNGTTGETVYGRSFFISCVRMFVALHKFNLAVVAQMMCIYLEKDATVKKVVIENFRKVGIEDPQKFFFKQLDTWDLPVSNDPNYKKEVVAMCEIWIKQWMQKLVEQTEYVIDELKSGNMFLPGTTGKKFTKQKKVTSADIEEPTKSIAAVLERIPSDVIDFVTPLEAINYFAECEFRDYLARGDEERRELMDTSNHRTVLVLPKVAVQKSLPRLGELSNTKCKPRKESTFVHHIKPPTEQSLCGFTTHINLPLKQVYMNPFKDEVDELMIRLQKEQPVLMMLKTQQKFFIPGNSVPPPS